MKRIVLLITLIFTLDIYGQTDTIPSAIRVGIGFGVNQNISANNYTYYISAIDNTLQRDKISNTGFVESVVLSYTPLFNYMRRTDSSRVKAPGIISILGSFDLSEFSTSTGFNTKVSGGLGVGINIQNTVQIGLFLDFTQNRYLRKEIASKLGQTISVNGNPLSSLDLSNNSFYYSDFSQSLSLKVIYLLGKRNSDVKSGVGNDSGIKLIHKK